MDNIFRKIALPLAMSVLAVSCTSTKYMTPEKKPVAIMFHQVSAETRSAVEGSTMPANSAFKVWGWYYGADGAMVGNVFDGTDVSNKTGEWLYDGYTRYWSPGYLYDFYAVYPSTLTDVTVNESGEIAINGFDCSKVGSEAVDLMTASSLGIQYNEGETPQPVSLNFNHELARIIVKIKAAEGVNATIKRAEFYGMAYKGDFTYSTVGPEKKWTNTISSSSTNTPFVYSGEENVSDTKELSLFGDMLLLPQSIKNASIAVVLDRGKGNETMGVSLPAAEWNESKSYVYTLTVEQDGITFSNFSVQEWNYSYSGGNVNIQ